MPLKSGSSTSTAGDNSQSDKNAEILVGIAKQSISGSGNRLVVGETDAAVQNALDEGGKFILVHPQVAEILKQKNFDVYLVYEVALRLEIASKISQIDFVGGNVDVLLQEWSGKLQDQAPVHVQQLLWLQANASSFGYERHGNSWKLKH